MRIPLQELESSINEALDWLDDAPSDADADDFQTRRKEIEQIANPIMSRLYNNQNQGSAGGENNFDFGDDEL